LTDFGYLDLTRLPVYCSSAPCWHVSIHFRGYFVPEKLDWAGKANSEFLEPTTELSFSTDEDGILSKASWASFPVRHSRFAIGANSRMPNTEVWLSSVYAKVLPRDRPTESVGRYTVERMILRHQNSNF